MATYATIRAAIKAKLDTITSIAFVYDTHRANLEGYPAVTFDVSDTDNDFLTNKENLRSIAFQIVIYQETTVKGLDEATNILDTVADAVVAAFEGDFSLSSAVDYCIPVDGARLQFETPQGLIVTQQITLKCYFASGIL